MAAHQFSPLWCGEVPGVGFCAVQVGLELLGEWGRAGVGCGGFGLQKTLFSDVICETTINKNLVGSGRGRCRPTDPFPDPAAVKIKKNKDNVKFKVRCSRYLYTLVITDKEKAEKLKQSLPPGTPCPGGVQRGLPGAGQIPGAWAGGRVRSAPHPIKSFFSLLPRFGGEGAEMNRFCPGFSTFVTIKIKSFVGVGLGLAEKQPRAVPPVPPLVGKGGKLVSTGTRRRPCSLVLG